MLEIEANLDTKLLKKKKKIDLYNRNTTLNCEINFQNYNYTKYQFFEGPETKQHRTHKRITTFSLEIGICSTLKTTSKIPHR